MPLTLAASAWLLNPFAQPLVSQAVSLNDLNPAQRANIQLAARVVNGTVLPPGAEFSFNKKVGPRTFKRGYRMARSYIGNDSPVTAGGGICCLSSLLYQTALAAGLKIEERVPHLRTLQTIAPGLDATVWYGSSDLRFRNDTTEPVMIDCQASRTQLKVQLLSNRFANRSALPTVRTAASRRNHSQLLVEVFRNLSGKELLVSRDLYRLSP
jgi:vancomycin resistance protein YoaR